MRFIFFISILIFSQSSFSALRKFDIISPGQVEFSYKDVCKSMGKETVLIQKLGFYSLDCMSETISTYDFCKKKVVSHNLLRAVIDEKNKKVICQKGKGAVLSVDCKKKGAGLCKSAKLGCQKLKTLYSHQVPLSFSGFSDSSEGTTILNCYFGDEGFTKLDI